MVFCVGYNQVFVLVFIYVCMSMLCSRAVGLDLNWMPADEDGDGPLPLSENYRDQLRKLCAILADPNNDQPPEIAGKREIIDRKCAKLKQSDSGSSFGSGSFGSSAGASEALGYIIAAAVCGYALWLVLQAAMPRLQARMDSLRTTPSADELREMRLKKFS
jgi:hypothetical protein